MSFKLEEHQWVDTLMTNYKMELKRIDEDGMRTDSSEISLVSLKERSVDDYLNLWQSVGKQWKWSSRLRLTPSQIQERVHNNPDSIVYEIRLNDQVIGISEYKIVRDQCNNDSLLLNDSNIYVEIMFFGLFEQFQGKGYGTAALLKTLQDIKLNLKIDRIILQTCQLDSPSAIPFYEKCGFDIFRTWNEQESIIEYN